MKEFQVLYRDHTTKTPGAELVEVGPLLVAMVRAEKSEQQSAELVVRGWFASFTIVALHELRTVIQPDQVIFTKEEAAEFLRCSCQQIDRWMGLGVLPKAKDGHPRFSRRMLEQVVNLRMVWSDGRTEADVLKEAA